MSSKFRAFDPAERLVQQLRAAAAQINIPESRRIAAREADRIPLTKAEKAHGRRGEMAKLGRAKMRQLPHLVPEEYADAVTVLRGCADAVDSRFEETSHVYLGRKGRSGVAA